MPVWLTSRGFIWPGARARNSEALMEERTVESKTGSGESP